MKTDSMTPLHIALNERNLAHFLASLALAGLAGRIEGSEKDTRKCCWNEEGQFSIYSEFPPEQFRALLFAKAHEFLAALEWIPGFGGVEHGILISGSEVGINPFVPLGGDSDERPLLRAFSAKVVPRNVLPQQVAELKSPTECPSWLDQIACGVGRKIEDGVSSWGYDSRVNMHASDAGISSDAEGTGILDPIFPAIELLSLAAAAFFVPAHAWTIGDRKLRVAAWTMPLPISMTALGSAGQIRGLRARFLIFASRGSAHGKGGSFRFFPEATLEHSTQQTP